MRVVITGGSGLIGAALAHDLGAAGHDVVVLSRDPGKLRSLPANVRAARWDGESAAGWADLAAGPDTAIVHLAGESIAGGRWTAERKRRISDSRLRSSAAVVQAIEQAASQPRVLLQGSAVGYYGPCGDEEVPEEHPPGDDFLARLCVEWEASTAATPAIDALGVRRAILRTGVVLARDGGALPKMALPFRMRIGGPLGSGRQWLPWIHLADEVGAIRFLLEDDAARGPFNLTAPTPARNRDLGAALGKVLHRPSLLPTPGFALHLALGEMAGMLLNGQRAVPKALLARGYRFRFPELGPALSDLLD
ncbi:MAG TPA: TIGR01777 family oxidoreductase [Thermoanaerobaculia bacterium]|nr:TIGR01777 family oxidoreductase [Thermoanaerobaculia bacterium]